MTQEGGTAERIAREFHQTQAAQAPEVARRAWDDLSETSRGLLREVFRDLLARGIIRPGDALSLGD